MIKTPREKRPVRPVPQSAQQHRDQQVPVGYQRSEAVAPQRHVEIVAQPRGKTDMPAPPEVTRADRKIGRVEIDHQLKPQPLRYTARNAGITRKITVDLKRKCIHPNQYIKAG